MKIILSEYNPNWSVEYRSERNKLLSSIGHLEPDIEHIGSTSIAGLAAKPIIDIMVGVKDESELEVVEEKLTQPSYVYLPIYNEHLPFRRFFIGVKEPFSGLYPHLLTEENFIEIPHTHRISHIHVVPIHSQWWEEHLLFRNYLNHSKLDLLEYEKLKRALSNKEWNNGNEYAAAKANLIQTILTKAKKMNKENYS